MKKTGVVFLAGIIVIGAVLIAGPGGTPGGGGSAASSSSAGQILLAGRNVNMVSGTKLPFGDPWLQRQNEPSIAASTRNPLHLLAGANDYRTIDIPDDFKLPGIERTAAADAWLGVYESFNGGESWITTLLPGFPQDASSEGQMSPLKGYETACDPIVRAGANGLFCYCGIAFNRDRNKSAIFVARYVDDNNLEKVEMTIGLDGTPRYSGPIQYVDTRLVATGSTSGSFIDMPNMAVDVPRGSARYGTIYVAYTVFSNTGVSSTADKIFLQRSTDGGVTWSTPPVQLSTTGDLVQRPIIAIDPIDLKGNTLYVAFRRFAKGNAPDGIVVVKSTNGGKTFSKLPDVAPSFYPFDQGTGQNPSSFRTNSYPTIAVGDLGTVYVAWSQRQGGPAGQARIMISSLRKGGLAWTAARVVDQTYAGIGHQFMPSLAFAAWKLMLAWYDQREDEALDASQFIGDSPGGLRHTVDVRAAEGRPGVPPTFAPSIRLSRYLHVLDLDANGHPIEDGGYYKVIQAEHNPINYPLFQLGTVPFHGDYLEVTPSARFLPPAIAFGSWIYNINPLEPTSFQTAWTDNRDVRPPNGDSWGDWVNYNAPASIQEGWPNPSQVCLDGSKTGLRNQNIYTANINKGLIMGSPGNTKQLDLPLTGEGGRTFVVFAKNTTEFERTLNLVLLQIGRVDASFDQFRNDDNIQVTLQPYSSVSCTVYVDRSTRKLAPVTVNAFEGSKLVGYVVLNPDPTNLPLSDPDNPFQDLGKESHDPDVSAPVVWNYALGDESDPNASSLLNPRAQNPRAQNDSVVNPRAQNEGVLNPRAQNESIVNTEVANPRAQNTVVPNGALTDVTWTVTNEGNTTSVFTTNIRSQWPQYFNGTNPPLIAQVLVYKIHRVPVDKDCQLYETHQDELIANITDLVVQNPRAQNSPVPSAAISTQAADLSAQDITFYLAPGEQAEVTFRVWDADTKDGSPTFSPDMVTAEAVAEAVNTEDVEGGGTTPPSDVPPNSEPWTTPPPEIGASPLLLSFAALLGTNPPDQAITVSNSGGGTLNYAVSDDAAWLSITPASGSLTPQDHTVSVAAAGLSTGIYTGTIMISDPQAANNPVRVPVTLSIATAPALVISTTSVPDGVRDASYSVFLNSSGGAEPITWSVVSGSLPPGLALENTEGGTGWITGSPTAAGHFDFMVQAEDNLHQAVVQPLSMTVADWVARYNGSGNGQDWSAAIAADSLGSLHVIGTSQKNETGFDYAAVKYTSSGTPLMAFYNGPGDGQEEGTAIALDAWGNIYVTGSSAVAGTDLDYATVKYDSNLNPLWVARYSGPGAGLDAARAIAVDASGNVYVTGYVWNGTDEDYATVKYDADGHQLWAASYDPANGYDYAQALALDSLGNVYVTGFSSGSGTGDDFATIKYDGSGNELWVARYNHSGTDRAMAIAVDRSGNVYVTGYSVGAGEGYDYATIKYDTDGHQLWVTRYAGPVSDDSPQAIAVDALANVYVTGLSGGGGTYDYATVKYDSGGSQRWVARYDGPAGGYDCAQALTLDPLGNVYVAGFSDGNGTDRDYATIKYDGYGNQVWVARYNGPANGDDRSYGIALSPFGAIGVTGYGTGIGTDIDLVTIRYQQTFPDTLIISTDVLDTGYVGTPYAEALWAFGGGGTRTWFLGEGSNLPDGLSLDSSTGIISGTPTTPGTYNFSVQVLDGLLVDSKSLSIAVTTIAGPPHQLAFSQEPTATVANAIITPAVTVEVQDLSGTRVATAANPVTLSLRNGSGILSGTLTKNAVGGIATFDDLSVNAVGTGYQLRANSGSLTEVDSAPFDITVAQPILSVDRTSVTVPFTAGTAIVSVSNTGTGTMDWTATITSGWSGLSIQSGSSGTNSGTITIAVTENGSMMPISGYIEVAAPGATGSPVGIYVTQRGAPRLTVMGSALNYSGPSGGPFTPTSVTLTVQNVGDDGLTWTAASGQAWTTLSAASGTLNANASAPVTVSINANANSLGAGLYADTVTFTNTANGDGNTTRPVNLTVVGALDHFDFSVIPTPQHSDVPFSITITAKDALENVVTSYAGTNALTADAGTVTRSSVEIIPATTGPFINGIWTGEVSFHYELYSVVIYTAGGGGVGASNQFHCLNMIPVANSSRNDIFRNFLDVPGLRSITRATLPEAAAGIAVRKPDPYNELIH